MFQSMAQELVRHAKSSNMTIKHQTQTQRWIQLFTGENQEYELVKDGLIINLPCEHAAHEYSLGERIF